VFLPRDRHVGSFCDHSTSRILGDSSASTSSTRTIGSGGSWSWASSTTTSDLGSRPDGLNLLPLEALPAGSAEAGLGAQEVSEER
jgi:hypothetical protein